MKPFYSLQSKETIYFVYFFGVWAVNILYILLKYEVLRCLCFYCVCVFEM